ncbi:hypothetical protein J6590_042081 [Homalodisca vitripennis]|nr:hypothetical protein J6590_042081 [Homalodisca vitripennis]
MTPPCVIMNLDLLYCSLRTISFVDRIQSFFVEEVKAPMHTTTRRLQDHRIDLEALSHGLLLQMIRRALKVWQHRAGWMTSLSPNRRFFQYLFFPQKSCSCHTTGARFGGSNYHLPSQPSPPARPGPDLLASLLNCLDDVLVKTPVKRQTTRKSYLKLYPTRTARINRSRLFVRLSPPVAVG